MGIQEKVILENPQARNRYHRHHHRHHRHVLSTTGTPQAHHSHIMHDKKCHYTTFDGHSDTHLSIVVLLNIYIKSINWE
jgi:hypothetical protein